MRDLKLLIDNAWCDAVDGATFEVENPATGEIIARVAEAGAADADLAVRAAKRARDAGAWSELKLDGGWSSSSANHLAMRCLRRR